MVRAMTDHRVDLLILDVMLPGEDGLSLCRKVRTESQTPIIMLTARGEDVDRILGLEMGADDYLAKPFNPRELLARINAVLRRQAAAQTVSATNGATALTFLGWRIDFRLRELRNPAGARVAMTSAEFDLLRTFCERPGRVLSRDSLLDLTQGRGAGSFERSIDVLVSRIRRKIEPDPQEATMIKTVRSGGYMFTPEVDLLRRSSTDTVSWFQWSSFSARRPRPDGQRCLPTSRGHSRNSASTAFQRVPLPRWTNWTASTCVVCIAASAGATGSFHSRTMKTSTKSASCCRTAR